MADRLVGLGSRLCPGAPAEAEVFHGRAEDDVFQRQRRHHAVVRLDLRRGNDEGLRIQEETRHPHRVGAEITFVENLDKGVPRLIQVNQLHAEFRRQASVAVVCEAVERRPVGGRFGDYRVAQFTERLEELQDSLDAVGVGGGKLDVDGHVVGLDHHQPVADGPRDLVAAMLQAAERVGGPIVAGRKSDAGGGRGSHRIAGRCRRGKSHGGHGSQAADNRPLQKDPPVECSC